MLFPMEGAAAHARECYPLEAAGLWVRGADGTVSYRPCGSGEPGRFRISPYEWLEAEARGAIAGVFHSHPDAPPVPSAADAAAMEAWGLPWVIVSVPSGDVSEYVPERVKAPRPLLGRPFRHGGDDCYGLIRDYYARLGVALPDFGREPGWWERGASLYLENYERAGFSLANDGPGPGNRTGCAPGPGNRTGCAPRPHDVILMQIHSPVPNHGAIYLGGAMMLHHIDTRLSGRTVYGDFYRKATTHVLRHRELMPAGELAALAPTAPICSSSPDPLSALTASGVQGSAPDARGEPAPPLQTWTAEVQNG